MSDETWKETVDLDEYERAAVTIDEHSLEQEMGRVPADFAYLNQRLVELGKARDVAERKLKEAEAHVYLASRAAFDAKKEKYTEKTLENLVRLNKTVSALSDALLETEANYRRAKSLCDAVRLKADMLTSIGMRVNAELKANPLAAAQRR